MASDTGTGVTYWDVDSELDHLRELTELTEAALTLRRERDELVAFLQMWIHDGCLQTFASREQLRRQAASFIAKHRGEAS